MNFSVHKESVKSSNELDGKKIPDRGTQYNLNNLQIRCFKTV